jgi:acetylornithine/succinyldiaminopimelate/putrescine aminotransferase
MMAMNALEEGYTCRRSLVLHRPVAIVFAWPWREFLRNDMVFEAGDSHEKIDRSGGDYLDFVRSFGCLFSGKDDEGTDDVLHVRLERRTLP